MAQLVGRQAHNLDVAGSSPAPASTPMRQVFTYWHDGPDAPPRQAELVVEWARAWARAGLRPRLLTSRDGSTPKAALKKVRGRFLVPLTQLPD